MGVAQELRSFALGGRNVGLIGLPGLSAICRTTEGAVFHSVDTSRTNGQKDVGS